MCKPADANIPCHPVCIVEAGWLQCMWMTLHDVLLCVCVCQSLVATHCMWLICLHVAFVEQPCGYTVIGLFACHTCLPCVKITQAWGHDLGRLVMTYNIVCCESLLAGHMPLMSNLFRWHKLAKLLATQFTLWCLPCMYCWHQNYENEHVHALTALQYTGSKYNPESLCEWVAGHTWPFLQRQLITSPRSWLLIWGPCRSGNPSRTCCWSVGLPIWLLQRQQLLLLPQEPKWCPH